MKHNEVVVIRIGCAKSTVNSTQNERDIVAVGDDRNLDISGAGRRNPVTGTIYLELKRYLR